MILYLSGVMGIHYLYTHIWLKILTGLPSGLISPRIAFSFLFFSFMYLVQRFWFVRAWRLSAQVKPKWKMLLRSVLIAVAILVAIAILDLPPGHLLSHRNLGSGFVSASRLWILASCFGYLAVLSVRVLELLSAAAIYFLPSRQRVSFDPARRAFLRYSALVAGSIPFLATGYGFASERLNYKVEKVNAPMANLPKALDGLRIVQVSDIHIGDFMPRTEVRRAVDMANKLQPDLVLITGDLISTDLDPLRECISELSRLRAPLGIWGCNGNHEHYAGMEELSRQLFRKNGMRLLRRESAELHWRGEKINLIGVDYQEGRRTPGKHPLMLEGLEPLIRRDIPNILLSHNPNTFYRAAEMGIELSVAGHTHGGQIQLEFINPYLSPARFMTKFVEGMYHLPFGKEARSAEYKSTLPGPKTASLYVNRGLGTFGMPVRLGAPPEITLLTLRAAV